MAKLHKCPNCGRPPVREWDYGYNIVGCNHDYAKCPGTFQDHDFYNAAQYWNRAASKAQEQKRRQAADAKKGNKPKAT